MTSRSESNPYPKGLWNTHIDCLSHLASALSLDWNTADIAGITGLAFRTALCKDASPASSTSTWDHAFYFQTWCSALGIDTDCYSSAEYCSNIHHWVDRRLEEIINSLKRGLPVIFYDSFGFAVINGYDESNRRFKMSGLPRKCIHPVWEEHPDAAGVMSRTYDSKGSPGENLDFLESWDVIGNSLTGTFTFVLPRGATHLQRSDCILDGVSACCRELRGQVSHQISFDPLQLSNQPLFGNAALTRLISELESRSVNHYGLIQAVNTLCEARLLGHSFLRSAGDALPQFKSQLDQSAEFAGRSCKHWRTLSGMWNLPMDRNRQMSSIRFQETGDLLYQIFRTEQTIGRLLSTISTDAD